MPNIPQNLKQAGLKTTLPRIKILEILKNNEVRHVSAEDVYKLLLESGDEIGLATVYRVLTDFENSNLVIRHNFEGGRSVFELNDQPEHDHMVCTECGHVFEFRDERMNERQKNLATNAGFSIADHSLYVYGTCDGIKDRGECDMPPRRDLDIIVKK